MGRCSPRACRADELSAAQGNDDAQWAARVRPRNRPRTREPCAQPARAVKLRLLAEDCHVPAALGGSAAPLSGAAAPTGGRRPYRLCWPRGSFDAEPSCSRCPDPHSLALDAFAAIQLVRFMSETAGAEGRAGPWLKQELQQKQENALVAKATKEHVGAKMGKPGAGETTRGIRGRRSQEQSRSEDEGGSGPGGGIEDGVCLGILGGGSLAALNSVMKSEALGRDAVDAVANLDGADYADAYGNGGVGLVGVGPGADGRGDGTLVWATSAPSVATADSPATADRCRPSSRIAAPGRPSGA